MARRPIPADLLAEIARHPDGLSSARVTQLRELHGANVIVESPPGGWRNVAADTLRDPMLWFLLATSLLFFVTGDRAEAVVLLVAIVPLTGMDIFLHQRTQASTSGLSSRLASTATVVRAGARLEIPATEVVPGDLLDVAASEPFAADGLVVGGESLQADESALTGESWPVRKAPLGGGAADDASWVFAGTRLLTGRARVRVAYTGGATLYGEIVRSALSGARQRTPLQVAIAGLVRALVVAALGLCVALAWVRIAQGHGVVDGLVSAVTLAVAALPEEFPVVFTFFLGVGVYRLAKRQALVRRAVVVENIGRVSTICTDKTGTITEGQLRLAHAEPAGNRSAEDLVRLAALAARDETGDPVDIAVLRAAAGARAAAPLATFPFAEDRKRETVVTRIGGGLIAACKGAPEAVFAMCELDAAAAAGWQGRVHARASTGHKVIAVASRDIEASAWAGGEPDRGFELAGIIAFEDPVRDGVREAVTDCRNAGIRVVMVTGDHPATAAAIAAEIGLGEGTPRVVLAEDLERRIGGDAAAEGIGEIDVVARAVPAQKLALVRALQRSGEIVAVTGDGVNDVPALQAADISIAMGLRGTRSAREVASIVLLDDNFASLVGAIAEGRQLFSNLRLAFHYLLTIHLPLVATAALIPLAGYPLLYLPIHIVWLELIIHPTALLVFQQLPPPRLRWRRRRARAEQGRFFGRGEWALILVSGTLITLVVLGSYDRSLGAGLEVEHARAMALVALAVASATVTAALSRLKTLAARVVTACTLLSAVVLVQVPALAAWMHVEPLHADDWAIAAAGGVLAASISALRWLGGSRARRDR